MSRIHLGRGLDLPSHAFATNVVAALGMRGSGKSNLMTVAVEGLLSANVQVVILDYVGIWFGLRLQPNGKTESPFKIAILGGKHGDIPLISMAGRQVAEALAAAHSSAVLDISSFTKTERVKFAADFGEAFFHAKKSHEGPVFLVLEEAQRFVPQIMRFSDPALSRCLGAFEEIAEVGRNYGIGLGLISQRPQKINKDVLNLAELVFAFQTNGVLERKAIAEWVQEKGAEGRSEVTGELPGLERGTALVWSPSTFKLYGKYKFDLKTTYDAGATPDRVRAAVTVRQLDLKSLETAMTAVVAEARANDPRALKARIKELEMQVTNARVAETKAITAPATIVEKSVLKPHDLIRLDRLTHRLGTAEDAFAHVVRQAIDRLAQAQQAVVSELGSTVSVLKTVRQPAVSVRGNSAVTAVTVTRPPAPRTPVMNDPSDATPDHLEHEERLPEKSQRMLGALRQAEAMGRASMPFRNVAIIAGVSPNSGTTRNRKAQLIGGGYVIVQGDNVLLTPKGRAYPLNVNLPPEDPRELLAFWMREIGTEKIARILEAVVNTGPCTDEALAEAAGMEQSGTFRNYKAALTGRGLMVKRGDGTYEAAEVFN